MKKCWFPPNSRGVSCDWYIYIYIYIYMGLFYVRCNWSKFHDCRIYVTGFKEGNLFSPSHPWAAPKSVCAGVPCWFCDHQYLRKQSVNSFFWPFSVLFLVVVLYLLSNYCVYYLLFICFYFYFASNVNIADKIFVSSFCNFNNNGDW